MNLSGAELLLECLKREHVEVIFGHPGGVVLHIYDRLLDYPLKHILVRHEQAAVHAADGYARVSGRPGVCLVTSGPGATNTVTGLASAYMDSIPVVVLTGQVPTPMIGNDAFQEADVVGITRPCTKHNFLVKDVADLAQVVREAFYIASTGKPGPVLIDLPKDVSIARTEFHYPEKVDIRGYRPNYSAHLGQIKKAVELIVQAERPIIYAGGGVIASNASAELIELSDITQIPVTTTLMGLGGYPSSRPLWMGMLGMHGTYWANMAMSETDLMIAIGSRFDDRVTGKLDEFAVNAKIIHIDIDPSSISKNVHVDIPIVGDAKDALRKLNALLRQEKRDWAESRQQWFAMIEGWKKAHPLTYDQGSDVIKPQYVIEQIYEATQGEAIVSTEVGQHQMWAAQFYHFNRPRSFLTSGGLGAMGYGFPAAIGAQLASPDKLVFDIAGDGSFQMNLQELATVVQYSLPVKVAILNNRFLGMVRQWQEIFFNTRYSHTDLSSNPDFVKLAEAYGAVGLRAERPEEVRPVIEKAIATPHPTVIDFVVAREENVYPMIPAGAPINAMLLA